MRADAPLKLSPPRLHRFAWVVGLALLAEAALFRWLPGRHALDLALLGLTVAGAARIWAQARPSLPGLALTMVHRGPGVLPPTVSPSGLRETRPEGERYSQLLQEFAEDAQARQQALLGLIHDLLASLERMETLPGTGFAGARELLAALKGVARGAVTRPSVSAPLSVLVEEAVTQMHQCLPALRVRLELAVLPSVPLQALAIRRILENLIDNAYRHGGGLITVRTQSAGCALDLIVEDEGRGQPLTRLPVLTRDDQGLAVVTALVQVHDGKLALDRAPAGGLRVTVRLPGLGAVQTADGAG